MGRCARSLPALANRPYLTLDDFELRTQAESNPEEVVARAPLLVLDEVQRARDLLIAVKRAVDEDPKRTPGRFVLTGSANLLLMERVGETLAITGFPTISRADVAQFMVGTLNSPEWVRKRVIVNT